MNRASSSPEETVNLGKQIAADLRGGDIVALHGELGAGKTTLMKGIAEYFGIKADDVVSPTFTLLQVYPITNYQLPITQLVHIDTYRLKDEKELVDIGIEDYLGDPETVCVIEWPEKMENLLRGKKTIYVKFGHVSESERTVKIARMG